MREAIRVESNVMKKAKERLNVPEEISKINIIRSFSPRNII